MPMLTKLGKSKVYGQWAIEDANRLRRRSVYQDGFQFCQPQKYSKAKYYVAVTCLNYLSVAFDYVATIWGWCLIKKMNLN